MRDLPRGVENARDFSRYAEKARMQPRHEYNSGTTHDMEIHKTPQVLISKVIHTVFMLSTYIKLFDTNLSLHGMIKLRLFSFLVILD